MDVPCVMIAMLIPRRQALVDGMDEGMYVYPDGQDHNPDIRDTIHVPAADHVNVTQEQHDLYMDIDSTFQLCKICCDKDKSTRLEPCGHLLCQRCFDCVQSVSRKNGQHETRCPFCNQGVRSTESVVVAPYQTDDAAAAQELADDIARTWGDAAAGAAAATASSEAEESEHDVSESDDDYDPSYVNVDLALFVPEDADVPWGMERSATNTPSSRRATLEHGRAHSTRSSPQPPAVPPRTRGATMGATPSGNAGEARGGQLAETTARLCAMGFEEDQVDAALRLARGDPTVAVDALLQYDFRE